MINKKTVEDIDVKNKRVLVRCDFNVPLDKEDSSKITSDKRIIESLKTIKYLIEAQAKVILCSHIGKTGQNLSLAPVAKRLSELLGQNVELLKETIGPNVESRVKTLKSGEVVLLENLRNFEEEEANDDEFAKKLASLADIFVSDAFGTVHRKHASIVGIAKYLPAVSGFLIQKEIKALDHSINNPKRPLVAIIGGAKVSSKIDVINELLNKVDTILIGGAMTYTFVKAQGGKIGKSLCEDDKLSVANEIIQKAKEKNVNFVLPIDAIVAPEINEAVETKVADAYNIADEDIGVDIGPKTLEIFKEELSKANTIVWNGPVGIFEIPKFANGTNQIAELMANSNAITIIGGGDSVSAIEKLGLESKMTHISTGGGASLKFMEGKVLPGIDILQDK